MKTRVTRTVKDFPHPEILARTMERHPALILKQSDRNPTGLHTGRSLSYYSPSVGLARVGSAPVDTCEPKLPASSIKSSYTSHAHTLTSRTLTSADSHRRTGVSAYTPLPNSDIRNVERLRQLDSSPKSSILAFAPVYERSERSSTISHTHQSFSTSNNEQRCQIGCLPSLSHAIRPP